MARNEKDATDERKSIIPLQPEPFRGRRKRKTDVLGVVPDVEEPEDLTDAASAATREEVWIAKALFFRMDGRLVHSVG